MKNSMIIIIAGTMLLLAACGDWLDINRDPNTPPQVNEKLTLAAGISSVSYVYGGKYQVLGALWAQHWTQSLGASQYAGLDSYDINSSTLDNNQYGELFSGALRNFEYIRKISHTKQNWGYYLIATVMQCYTYQLLADLYDEIPFSEALRGDEGISNPQFEKGANIYDSLIARIEYALAQNFNAPTVDKVGEEDLIFNGSLPRWRQFAHTLQLKIYLRQVNVGPSRAEAGIRALYEDKNVKFLNESAAMTEFVNESGRSNPLWDTEIRQFGNNPNLIMSNTLYSYLFDIGDLERLNAMFDFPQSGGGHKALVQGNYRDPSEPAGTNSTNYSKPVFSPFHPVYLMSETESKLLQSEAIVRFSVKPYNEAKELYQEGVLSSYLRLMLPRGHNFNDIATIAESFYGPGRPYEFPPEGSEFEVILERITIQKWISLAGIQSLETFFEQSRTGYPRVSPIPGSHDDYKPGEFTVSVNNVTSGKLPRRLVFPESEYAVNPKTPARKEVYEPIWWDISNSE